MCCIHRLRSPTDYTEKTELAAIAVNRLLDGNAPFHAFALNHASALASRSATSARSAFPESIEIAAERIPSPKLAAAPPT